MDLKDRVVLSGDRGDAWGKKTQKEYHRGGGKPYGVGRATCKSTRDLERLNKSLLLTNRMADAENILCLRPIGWQILRMFSACDQ